jgi:hypothetical protein
VTKVWKRTGAIAVYSPARATAVVVVAVLAVVGLGFVAGLAAGDDGGEQLSAGAAGAPPASVPQQPAAAAAAADPGPEADGEAADVAYRRGYRKGLRRGSRRAKATAPAGLRPNGAYFVRVSRSGGSLSHRTQIEQGATYWLCAGGSRLCMRGGGG